MDAVTSKALQGKTYQRNKGMFWYKWQARPDSTGDTRAISYIEGNYKIIKWLDEDLVELFDLNKDVGEQKNLAAQMPEKTKLMLATLLEIEKSVGNLREKGRRSLEKRLEKFEKKKKRKKAK